MRQIRAYRLPLPRGDRKIVTLALPIGAVPLCLVVRDQDLRMSAMVDPHAPVEDVSIELLVPGDHTDLPPDRFIGAATSSPGNLTWHAFIRPKDRQSTSTVADEE